MTPNPPNSRGPVVSVIRDLSAAEIATLNSAPVALVVGQGAGTVIVPVSASFQYKPGTVPFGSDATMRIRVGTDNYPQLSSVPTDGLVANVRASSPGSTGTLVANTALTLSTSSDPGFLGPIATSALNSGGLLYSVNDTGTIDGGSTLATYKVLSVGGGGAVATYSIETAGQGYAVATGVTTTVTTGGGDGTFTIDILTITNASDGTGRIEVLYYVMPLR